MAASKQARMGWGGEGERGMGVRGGEGNKKRRGREQRERTSPIAVCGPLPLSPSPSYTDCVKADVRSCSCGNGGSAPKFRSGMIWCKRKDRGLMADLTLEAHISRCRNLQEEFRFLEAAE